MRVFLELCYKGAGFHGWQIQPSDISVQETIEKAMATLLRQPVAVTGAGRTDTGVNAMTMVAHADIPDDTDLARLVKSLNALCRPNIAFRSATRVHDVAHARFDATSRTYRYFVHTTPDPFVAELSWLAPPGIDFDAMNRAAQLLIGKRDYTSFAKLHADTKTNICDIHQAQWVKVAPTKYYFEITADRFLRNMVRAVVGTLVDIGRGKYAPESILDTIARMDRCAAGTSMPAHPLFLWDVTYPYFTSSQKS